MGKIGAAPAFAMGADIAVLMALKTLAGAEEELTSAAPVLSPSVPVGRWPPVYQAG